MLKIVLHGIYRNLLPKGYRRGVIWLDAHNVREVIAGLEQLFPAGKTFNQFPAEFRIGKTLKKSRPLTLLMASQGQIPTPNTLHIAPDSGSGNEITTALIITALVNVAISVGVSLLMAVLFPPDTPNTVNSKRASVLYENSLNTQREGVPLAYIAGDRVLCGSNVIEGDIDINEGGGLTGTYTPATGATAAGAYGRGGIIGLATYVAATHPDGYDELGETVTGSKGGSGGNTIANNQFSDALVRVLAAPGAGPVGGIYGASQTEKEQNIYINEVPLRDPGTGQYNYQGITWTERFGEEGQEAVKITPGISTPFAFDADLTAANTTGIPQTVTSAAVNRVKIRVRMALCRTDGKGNQHNTDVTLRVDTKRVSDSSWTHFADWNWAGKSSEPFQRQMQVAAPPLATDPDETWLFRVVRVTADSTDDKLVNTTRFDGWVEIQDQELTYDGTNGEPPTALFGCSLDLSQFNNSQTPQLALIMAGRKCRVPTNYDPVTRVYTGVWSGDWKREVTSNPVWHWYELATAKDVGAGLPDNYFNKFELLPTAKYCDEIINGKPRFTLNKQFTDEADAWQLLMDLAHTFRAVPYNNGSGIVLVQDRPQEGVDHVVNNAQVEGGLFTYNSTDIGDRINVCEVEWDNPNDYYRKAVLDYSDDDSIATNQALGLANNGRVVKRIYKIGCTSEQEAYDYARLLVWLSQNEAETVTWNTSITAASYVPGQLVEVHDWNINGLPPVGRVAEVIDANTIKLDTSVTLTASMTYHLHAAINDGLQVLNVPMVSVDTTTDTLTITAHGLEVGSPVNVVKEGGVQPVIYRVVSIEEKSPGKFAVTAHEHKEGKYAWLDDDVPVAIPQWTQLSTTVPTPTGLTVNKVSAEDDVLGSSHALQVSWNSMTTFANTATDTPAVNVRAYKLEMLAPGEGIFRELYLGQSTAFTIRNVLPGNYVFSVKSINMLGSSSEPAVETFDLAYEGTSALLPPIFSRLF